MPEPTATEPPVHRYTAALANEIERLAGPLGGRGHVPRPNPVGPGARVERSPDRPKLFVLDMFPYPSGSGLHVGHPLGYIATDVFARFQRMNGFNVLHTMGYDAFGLPAEQYAVQTGQHPRVTTEENIANMRRQLRAPGAGPRRAPQHRHHRPDYYRWTQWIFLQIFNSWYDADADRARPIAELVAELEAGTARPTPDGRAGGPTLDAVERRRVVDAYRLAYLDEAPVNWCPGLGTVLANEEVTADGRSERGNFPVYKRPLTQWMMRITAYADRLLDDLDRARLARADQADAAQLDRAQRGRAGRLPGRRRRDEPPSRCSPPGPTRCSAPPSWCWRPSTRWSTRSCRRRGPTARPRRGRAARPTPRRRGRGVPGGGRAKSEHRAPGRGQGEDRRLHRRLRHQPGQRRADPGLHRRLRADGLRHRRDHGRARPGPARLGVRRRTSACPIVRTVQPPDGWRRRGLHRRRAGHQQRLPRRPGRRRGQARDHRVARGRGRRRGHGHLQAARLAVQPPALLGRAVPDRLRRDRPADRAARVDAAGRAARDRRLRARSRRRRRRHASPSRRWRRATDWVDGRARPRRRPERVPARAQHDAAVGRAPAGTTCATSTPRTTTRFVDPEVERYWMGRGRGDAAASTSTSAASSTPCCTCSTPASGTRCCSTWATVDRPSRSTACSTRATSRRRPTPTTAACTSRPTEVERARRRLLSTTASRSRASSGRWARA